MSAIVAADVGKAVAPLGLLELDDAKLQAMAQHLTLLLKWNKAFNLTAIRDPDDVLALHLADSLSIAPFIRGDLIYDIGTGGGFPGLPLAILYPEKNFVLVDASAKKIRFLTQTIKSLKLENVEALHARVEAITPEQLADQVVSRAFSSMAKFVSLTEHLLAADGEWLAMKGRFPETEIKELGDGYQLDTVQLDVPGVAADRHLITLRTRT